MKQSKKVNINIITSVIWATRQLSVSQLGDKK